MRGHTGDPRRRCTCHRVSSEAGKHLTMDPLRCLECVCHSAHQRASTLQGCSEEEAEVNSDISSDQCMPM